MTSPSCPLSSIVLRAVALVLLLAGISPAFAAGGGASPSIDWLSLALQTVGGLALFLYGVDLLATALKAAAGTGMAALLERAARRKIGGLASGTAASVALDSSSVTIILLIAIVDAGLLSFGLALPVILGANIGTTISSQIFAWNIDAFAPLLVAAGLAWRALAKTEPARHRATALLGLGLVLFGLNLIGAAAEPLKGQEAVIAWLRQLENPIVGVLAGAALTVALQSSSAMMGIVIVLASGGVISLPAGIAIMLGAEIGTCADTLVATLGRSRAAVRAGVFHLLFNIAAVAVGVMLIDALVAFGAGTATDTGQRIANAHVLFNVAGALLALPFTGVFARWLERLIPDRSDVASRPVEAVAAV